MSDAEDATNEVNDDLDNEQNDYDEAVTLPPNVVDASPSTTTVSSAIESSSSAIGDEYDDEPLEDYVVKLIVNGEPDSSTSAKDLIQAGITDTIGNLPSKTSDVIDAINGYTSTVFDELAGSTTAITGEGKRFFSKSIRIISWRKNEREQGETAHYSGLRERNPSSFFFVFFSFDEDMCVNVCTSRLAQVKITDH